MTRPELCQHLRADLGTLNREFGELMKRLDALGAGTSETHLARLLEDIERVLRAMPRDT